jgi:hypothetical protein
MPKTTFLRLTLVALGVLFQGCAERERADAPTAAATPASESANGASPPASATTNAASLAEARDALERVYRRAVSVDERSPAPALVGDFNGDGSEDIAVAVKPSDGALEELNSEVANWIVQDPRRAVPSGRLPPGQPGSWPAKIEPADAPLALIHGHGPRGWRDPNATQSYLLKNVAGEGLRVVPLRQFPPALRLKKRAAASKADIISGKLNGVSGFLYWASGEYAWQEQ